MRKKTAVSEKMTAVFLFEKSFDDLRHGVVAVAAEIVDGKLVAVADPIGDDLGVAVAVDLDGKNQLLRDGDILFFG